MRVSRRFLGIVFLSAVCALGAEVNAQSRVSKDASTAAAEQILGPQWKQLSRRAGMIFSGTMVSGHAPEAHTDSGVPSIELRFQVERAIAGVQPGQVLTIHEWNGAWSQRPPIRVGEHVLLFLYPPSHLGLTSPVGGAQGQIRLDAHGKTIAGRAIITQLEAAIRRAREE